MKKKFLILSLVVLLILSLLSVVTEAYSFAPTMTAKPTRVSAGDEVLVTVRLSNMNVPENGISSFSAYLSYDTEFFETLTDSSIDGMNGWIPNYTTGTGKVSLYKRTFLKTDEDIMQITLKTKAGLADGTQGEIKLSTIIISDGTDEIMASPISTSITIGSGTVEPDVNPNGNTTATPIPIETNTTPTPATNILPTTNATPTPAENNTTNEANNNATVLLPTNNTNTQNQNGIRVANEAESDIPYTGTDSNALARIIIGVIFIGLVLYIKIQRMDKEIR
ncbi:MAG: hypothetical protein IJ867_05085 [Clostridia bacterium]|nr:hypothetical protein [Clostridia bacterium]